MFRGQVGRYGFEVEHFLLCSLPMYVLCVKCYAIGGKLESMRHKIADLDETIRQKKDKRLGRPL